MDLLEKQAKQLEYKYINKCTEEEGRIHLLCEGYARAKDNKWI